VPSEVWRCIPSLIDEPSGEVLCYTVRETKPGLFEYAKRWWPIEAWLKPDGSYRDIRVELT
jgi:hypothetical protein